MTPEADTNMVVRRRVGKDSGDRNTHMNECFEHSSGAFYAADRHDLGEMVGRSVHALTGTQVASGSKRHVLRARGSVRNSAAA